MHTLKLLMFVFQKFFLACAPVIALAGLGLWSEIMFDSHTHCRVQWEHQGWAAIRKTTYLKQI